MKMILKAIIPYALIREYQAYKKRKKIKPYLGDTVQCVICKYEFKKFASLGPNKRDHAKCWNCGSLERHRLLWSYLNHKTDILSKSKKVRVLHFAPEKVFYDIFSKNNKIDYVPCDLSPEKYNFRKTVRIKKVDITNIPFEDYSFDVILCNHVLEHIPEDARAMTELYRVMKKGAWGIFQVPIDYGRETTYEDFTIISLEEREKAFGQRDHVRWYGQDYKTRLQKAGFKVTEDNYVQSFSSDEISKYGLMPTELIYYCEK